MTELLIGAATLIVTWAFIAIQSLRDAATVVDNAAHHTENMRFYDAMRTGGFTTWQDPKGDQS